MTETKTMQPPRTISGVHTVQKAHDVHLVCNAHIDPVWLWDWPEGVGAALSTFRVAAEFCEQNDTFIFAHNEAILYQWVEEHDPALFRRIQALVKAGKWRIMGGWYLQSDCNMPSGEAIVRQILTGRRYFQEKFGVTCRAAVNVDCFGHSKGLVQILEKAGYTGYVFMRPDVGTGLLDDLPQSFCWEGYAGSRIIGYRLNTGYNTLIGQAAPVIEDYIKEHFDGRRDIMRFWGIGDHGGGPSREDLQAVNAMIEREKGHISIRHSHPEAYLESLDIEELPVFSRDLNPIDAGCYTSMKRVKQLHRRLEGKLLSSEKLASLCDMAGLLPYPAQELQDAWKALLFCEFHDILPGTCIPSSEEDAVQKLHHGLEICGQMQVRMFYALASAEKAPAAGDIPIFLLNPHPYPVTGVFSCEFMLENQNWSDTFTSGTMYQGEEALPTQIEKEKSSMNLDWRKKVCFKATLKPLSLNRFDCKLTVLPCRPFTPLPVTQENAEFVCGDMTYTLDLVDGSFASIRKNGCVYAGEGFGRLLVYHDDCDPWLINGKEIVDYAGQFTLLDEEGAAAYAACSVSRLAPIRIVEDGDVRFCIEVLLGWRNSRARVLYCLPKDGSEMQVFYTVHWNEKDTMLRACMTHSFSDAVYTGEDMFGNKPLSVSHEMVAQKWVAAADSAADRAMAVINDSCYGFKLDAQAIEPSLLRSPTYSCHEIRGARLPLDRYYPRMEQGERRFGFTVLFGTRRDIAERADLRAQVMNEEPLAISFFPDGNGRTLTDTMRVSGVRLDACKKSEDGRAYILRLYNYHNEKQEAIVDIPLLGLCYRDLFEAMEIKTLRFDSQGIQEVPLLEEG